MAIEVECDRCGDRLTEPGALAFSPPESTGRCDKVHLCGPCWTEVYDFIRSGPPGPGTRGGVGE